MQQKYQVFLFIILLILINNLYHRMSQGQPKEKIQKPGQDQINPYGLFFQLTQQQFSYLFELRKEYQLSDQKQDVKAERDVQKYGKFDHFLSIFRKFVERHNLTQILSSLDYLTKRKKLSLRSLKYIFCALGLLNRFKSLKQFSDFYQCSIEVETNIKYPNQTLNFKLALAKKAKKMIKSIKKLLEGDFDEAIWLAYSREVEEEKCLKGRTKNPKQMKACLDLYYELFAKTSTDITPKGFIKKQTRVNY